MVSAGAPKRLGLHCRLHCRYSKVGLNVRSSARKICFCLTRTTSTGYGYTAAPNGSYDGYAVTEYRGSWYLAGYANYTEASKGPSTLDYTIPGYFIEYP